jgi:hypothetical protein
MAVVVGHVLGGARGRMRGDEALLFHSRFACFSVVWKHLLRTATTCDNSSLVDLTMSLNRFLRLHSIDFLLRVAPINSSRKLILSYCLNISGLVCRLCAYNNERQQV